MLTLLTIDEHYSFSVLLHISTFLPPASKHNYAAKVVTESSNPLVLIYSLPTVPSYSPNEHSKHLDNLPTSSALQAPPPKQHPASIFISLSKEHL
jgi:hypothetical protein